MTRRTCDDVIGTFHHDLVNDAWEWSEVTAAIHGYRPGAVTPTTELVLSHKHPDDREDAERRLARVREDGAPFGHHHRIVDAMGGQRRIVVVGGGHHDEEGRLVGVRGYVVDLTDAADRMVQEEITARVEGIVADRAVVEQAKGALMLVYGIGPDLAFGLLRWRSQESNVKLRELAEQLVRDLQDGEAATHDAREKVSDLLLTLHRRMAR
jgi:hypothetical protein